MSRLDGLGHPNSMTAENAANTLKFISDDHPFCAFAISEIVAWLESLCPNCNAPRTYYDGWHCPWELIHNLNALDENGLNDKIIELTKKLEDVTAEKNGIFRELELTEMQVVMLKNQLAVKNAWAKTDHVIIDS